MPTATADITLRLPSGWNALTQQQLRQLLRAMAATHSLLSFVRFRSQDDYAQQSFAMVATTCLCKWCGLPTPATALRNHRPQLPPQSLLPALDALQWIRTIPTAPVRLDEIAGHASPYPADLSERFSFDSWLGCENLWQGYLATNNDELLRQMAEILYAAPGVKPSPAELLAVYYWWASVKEQMAALFPDFFKPASPTPGPPTLDVQQIRRNMDAQIRALTKGDVTREQTVLALSAYRALTELDAQAREYDELNRRFKK